MRVLTLNIWNLSGDWRARRGAIVAVIRHGEPDVVCLQEVVESERGNQAQWLAETLGGWPMAFAGARYRAVDGVRFGNAILSRRPIEATGQVDLPGQPDEQEVQRVVLHARTGGVDVYCTHLAWQLHDAALREQQVCEERAQAADPTGLYAGYPCWAREAFGRGAGGRGR